MKKVLSIGIKIFFVVVGLVLFRTALGYTFTPEATLQNYGISVADAQGMNVVRGDIGGLLLGLTIFLAMAVVRGGHWYSALGVLASTVLVIRTFAYLQGQTGTTVFIGIILESLVVIGCFVLHYFEKNASKS